MGAPAQCRLAIGKHPSPLQVGEYDWYVESSSIIKSSTHIGQNSWTLILFLFISLILFLFLLQRAWPFVCKRLLPVGAAKLFLQYSSSLFLHPTFYHHTSLKWLNEKNWLERKKNGDFGRWKAEVWLLLAQKLENVSAFLISAYPVYHSNRTGESEACPASSGSVCPAVVQAVECVSFNPKMCFSIQPFERYR